MPHSAVPQQELTNRLAAFRSAMQATSPEWALALLDSKLTMFYFTGTMQDGILAISPDEAVLFVRRSLDCALKESGFTEIRPMKSFRSLLEVFPKPPKIIHAELATLTLQKHNMLQKHLAFDSVSPIDGVISNLRAVKSAYEIEQIRTAGAIHSAVIEGIVPSLLREGVSEARLCSEIHAALLDRHAMGISRYNQPIGEDVIGYCSFCENGVANNGLDSPTGTIGTSLAMKGIGSTEHTLKKNSLIVLDIASGYRGYHTDKTMNYFYGDLAAHPQGALIQRAHDACIQVEKHVARLLVPGAIPNDVYHKALAAAPEEFQKQFMNGVSFIGHSIGLTMDEKPVLANKFNDPIQANMVFAVEPKINLPGIGLIGTENTYLVASPSGAQSITGSPDANWLITPES